jgi:hypothetical protein
MLRSSNVLSSFPKPIRKHASRKEATNVLSRELRFMVTPYIRENYVLLNNWELPSLDPFKKYHKSLM